MTVEEFINRALAIPWVRWGSDWGGADCFGLLVLWHRHVLGVELGEVPQTDIESGFSRASGWAACSADNGAACFMAYRNGAPEHCGIVIDAMNVLHAQGCVSAGGRVRVSRLEVLRRQYGDIQFFAYNGKNAHHHS